MRDMHCHILPGVDDGAKDLAMSLDMLEAAHEAGVTSIVCTPHARDPYFDYDAMWQAYHELKPHADAMGMPLSMGFEVAHAKLVELGVEEWAPRLAFDGGREFLLELDPMCTEATFRDYERTIFELQGLGYDVIIAHPERYRAIQQNADIAVNLVRMGCKLQASADFVAGGRLGKEKRPAKKLFDQLLYRFIASDAHRPEHYAYLASVAKEYPTRGAHMAVA